MRNDPLARNIAEVIDDLYRQHAPPRDHERLISLVQHQIEKLQPPQNENPAEDESAGLTTVFKDDETQTGDESDPSKPHRRQPV